MRELKITKRLGTDSKERYIRVGKSSFMNFTPHIQETSFSGIKVLLSEEKQYIGLDIDCSIPLDVEDIANALTQKLNLADNDVENVIDYIIHCEMTEDFSHALH